MEETYSVIIDYHSGRREGQTITVDGIDPDDILLILGEITQDQLSNAEIIIGFDGTTKMYEDFMIDYFTSSVEKPVEMN